jgi:murein DD-endopeptidase MepM/ murein hydrolase activator NlpD
VDTRLLLAWLHLLALAVGLGGVWSRARALRRSFRDPEDVTALGRAFVGNAWWRVALVLWVVTGLWRLLAGTEKPTGYYFASRSFSLKLALVVAVLALEAWPMKTLFRWRAKRAVPDPRDARRIEMISYVQCALVVIVVAAAASVARGGGPGPTAPAGGAAPVAVSGAPAEPSHDAPPLEPSGLETVTGADIALLTREIAMPLAGIDPASLRSNFDERRGGGTRQHQALDIMAPRRTVVRSAAKGRVLKLFTSAAGGLMIYAADSSERFILMYAHLDDYAAGLRDGVRLARGQPIGYVGSTGNASASAPHLHFAVARSADVKRWSKGKAIDPLPILQGAVK